jgi:hypothetical protein
MALALVTASIPTAFAQTAPTTTPDTSGTTTPPTAPTGKDKDKGLKKLAKVLTPAELAQYQKDQAAALAANPDLKKEADALAAQRATLKSQGDSAPPDAKSTLKLASKEHAKKVEIAMLKIDPSIQPVLAKIKAAHKADKNAGAGAPAPAPATT